MYGKIEKLHVMFKQSQINSYKSGQRISKNGPLYTGRWELKSTFGDYLKRVLFKINQKCIDNLYDKKKSMTLEDNPIVIDDFVQTSSIK